MHVRYLPRNSAPVFAGCREVEAHRDRHRSPARGVRSRGIARRWRPVILAGAPLSDALPGDITFVEHDRHLAAWNACPASAAIVPPGIPVNGRPLIRVADPLMAFVRVVQHLRGRPVNSGSGISPTARIHSSVKLGDGVTIGHWAMVGEGTEIADNCTLHAGVVVGQYCKLGRDVTLHPHVVLYDDSILGHRVMIHANAVIGADGFGYRIQGGRHVKVPQLGWVEIEDDVEIGACTHHRPRDLRPDANRDRNKDRQSGPDWPQLPNRSAQRPV